MVDDESKLLAVPNGIGARKDTLGDTSKEGFEMKEMGADEVRRNLY